MSLIALGADQLPPTRRDLGELGDWFHGLDVVKAGLRDPEGTADVSPPSILSFLHNSICKGKGGKRG